MRKTILFMSLLGLFFHGKSQRKTPPPDELAGFIHQKGDSLLKAKNLPGIFVGLFDGEKKFFSFGYADPTIKIPFDSSTVFEVGSITKTFTAYILETVLQAKGIEDTAFILPYLPDSVQTNKSLAAISFLSLLNHTSGLPRLPDNLPQASMTPYDQYTANDLFAYLKNCTPKPDGKSSYSNLGAGLAGVLAERIAGTDYKTLLRTHVFEAFNMKDALRKETKKATGHFGNSPHPFWNMNVLYPAGGAQCSASDMLHYLQAMSRLSSANNTQGVLVKKLLTPTASVNQSMNVCRAWHTLEQKGKPTIYWHNGGTFGFSTFAAFEKNSGRAVIVVVNQASQSQVSDGLGIAIMRKMLE